MCLTWCRHGRPRRLTCQVPVAGHQRRDRSRAFPGPVLRGVVRNRPSGAPGRQKLEDVCGPPGRMSPLNEGHDHDDSAECPCHWRASSSGEQGSKRGKTGRGEARIFPGRWPFTRDFRISIVCFASRGSWVRFPSSPPDNASWDGQVATCSWACQHPAVTLASARPAGADRADVGAFRWPRPVRCCGTGGRRCRAPNRGRTLRRVGRTRVTTRRARVVGLSCDVRRNSLPSSWSAAVSSAHPVMSPSMRARTRS